MPGEEIAGVGRRFFMILATNVASPGFVSAGLYSTMGSWKEATCEVRRHLPVQNTSVSPLRTNHPRFSVVTWVPLAEVCRWSRGSTPHPSWERHTNTSAGSNLIRELSESSSTQSMDLPPQIFVTCTVSGAA
jgi:hypothetical protein